MMYMLPVLAPWCWTVFKLTGGKRFGLLTLYVEYLWFFFSRKHCNPKIWKQNHRSPYRLVTKVVSRVLPPEKFRFWTEYKLWLQFIKRPLKYMIGYWSYAIVRVIYFADHQCVDSFLSRPKSWRRRYTNSSARHICRWITQYIYWICFM